MVNYWLTLTNEDNWIIIKEKDVYAFNDANKKFFDELRIGDFLVMYVIRKKFSGIFKIVSKKVDKKIDFKGDRYVHQIKLKEEIVPKDPINANEKIISNISIFRNSIHWGTVLFGKSIKKITKDDYEFLKSQMMKG